MKRIFPIASALLFAACASKPTTVSTSSPRYATPEESARLHNEARANFQRERESRGMLAVVGSGPASRNYEAQRLAAVQITQGTPPSAPRRRWSMAEARYAMDIGKSPADLTPGERAVARSY